MRFKVKTRKFKINYKITDHVEPHIIKLYLVILAVILLTAVLVVIGVNIYRYSSAKSEMDKPQLYSEQDISSILKSPGLIDFIIPESLELGESGFSLFREPVKKWTGDVVEHYIIPPEELGIDKISQESKNIIEMKMDEIP